MTFVSMEKVSTAPIANRLVEFVTTQRKAHANRKLFARTLRELRALSNRELNDLGLCRSSIVDVAQRAVFDK